MQFFPESTSSNVSALGGVALGSSSRVTNVVTKASDFLDSLNKELAASGVTPVVDTSVRGSLPVGFRTVKRDVSAKLDREDVTNVMEKLRKRGVDDAALTGIEGLLNNDITPTIGNIVAAISGRGRASEDLTDEEFQALTTAFQKLQFSADETDELYGYMQEGNGPAALRMLKTRAGELGEGSLTLNKGEINAIMRGLDISEDAMKKVAALFGSDDSVEVDMAALEELLSPATAEFAAKRAGQEKMAAQFKDVIDETLREKKVREQTALVSDTRGSKLTDRAERRMRDDLTAKANGLGEEGRENSMQRLEEEEAALADEEFAKEQRRETHNRGKAEDRRTVSALDAGRGKEDSGVEKAPSSAREGFSTVINRLDVASGMTAPVQNEAATPQQNAAAAQTHRQEIFSQVEQGMLKQLADGSRQMVLRLDPAELGHVSLLLTVKGGEVRALIRAENPEAAAALSEQMNQLRATLEEQGLKVAQLDVETQLPQDTTKDQWSEMAQFGKEQEMREQARFLQLAKLRRESGTTLARDMQDTGMREEISASGLHIIA